ncbi:MAG: ATP-grasp domain-containing protein [Candidatus Andersenbacteria bacterium]
MIRKKPRVVVFYGGSASNHDLSTETGQWVCQYVPREQYDVTPVEITTDGLWKVPLGSLPRSGSIGQTLTRLSEAVPALSPDRALERLLHHPVQSIFTLVRGHGGDDGSMHSLGSALRIPVVGSPYHTCQRTSDKYLFANTINDITTTPYTRRFRKGTLVEDVLEDIKDEFLPPVFVKPVTEEGSIGIERVETPEELEAAIRRHLAVTDIILQEHRSGTELAITLTEDARGHIIALPPTIIVPQKTAFYDHLAKRRAGRVALHTPATQDNAVIAEATEIARNIYDELGCRGVATIDMIAEENTVDVLEVNTIPTLSTLTPLQHQLKKAGLHPATFFDSLIKRSWI